MSNNINIDDLISTLVQFKNQQQNNFTPVAEINNTSNIASAFGDILGNLQNNQKPQDIASVISSVVGNLSNNQNNQSSDIQSMLAGLFSNQQTQNENPQSNLQNILSGMFGNTQNNPVSNGDISSVFEQVLGGKQGQNSPDNQTVPVSNLLNMAGPLFKNMQNTSANSPRMNLLTAAKPFLGASFVPQIDHGIRLVSMAKTAKMALGGLGSLSNISNIK